MLYDCIIGNILCCKILSWIIVSFGRFSHLKQVDALIEHLQRHLSVIMTSSSTTNYINRVLKLGVVLLLLPNHAQ